jgi:hypothetical protein
MVTSLPDQCGARSDFRPLGLSPSKRLVGVRGFEPPAPASRTQCSTRLSYTPTEGRRIAAVRILGKALKRIIRDSGRDGRCKSPTGYAERGGASELCFALRLCHASMSCSTVAAVSSIERRVTSMVGHPRLLQKRLAHRSSARTASSST